MRGELLVSERLYGALLYLYPKEFRAAYGQHMRLTFRDACRAAYARNGAGGLLALWLPTLLDLLKSALGGLLGSSMLLYTQHTVEPA